MKLKFNLLKKKENFWRQLSTIIFRVSFVSCLVLFIVDYLIPGFVTNWFNPIWLLIVALISGLIVVIFKE